MSRLWFSPPKPAPAAAPHTLWVDLAGCFALFTQDRVRIGGLSEGPAAPDVPLLAPLSRNHATVVRCQEGYVLEAYGPTAVNGVSVRETVPLHDGDQLTLGQNVRLLFRLPSPLSGTARIYFESDHRPRLSVDGILLLDETCLLGPSRGDHVSNSDWKHSVLLFRRGEELWYRSRDLADKQAPGAVRVGTTIAVHDIQFRLE